MSLAKLVLRQLTVLSLVGKTLAGNDVMSSVLAPLNEVKDTEQRPVVAVFTDSAKADDAHISGRDIIGAQEVVTLALEIGIFTAAPPTDGDGETIVGIPESDEGMEITIDIIQRQAVAELQTGMSVFSDLWRAFVFRVVGTSTERGAGIQNGVRFAARRFEIQCETLSDPIPGQALPSEWERAIAALEGDMRTATLGALVRTIAVGAPLTSWQQIKGELGLIEAAARMVSIGPLTGGDDDVGELIAATVVAGDDKDRGETIKVDAAAATIGPTTGGVETPLIEPDEV